MLRLCGDYPLEQISRLEPFLIRAEPERVRQQVPRFLPGLKRIDLVLRGFVRGIDGKGVPKLFDGLRGIAFFGIGTAKLDVAFDRLLLGLLQVGEEIPALIGVGKGIPRRFLGVFAGLRHVARCPLHFPEGVIQAADPFGTVFREFRFVALEQLKGQFLRLFGISGLDQFIDDIGAKTDFRRIDGDDLLANGRDVRRQAG
ncbi:MAG: hypothetical protein BWY66_02814 [bacterium ADurb.Bin374]|nr:MAG: hypothetical protein BWY66_02814 [bacterium ADurb.Bin374]